MILNSTGDALMGTKRGSSKKREANGRLSRKPEDQLARVLEQVDRDVRDTLTVGLEARVRVHGVKPEDSRDQMAGSFVGRLCMQRVISRQQYEAAMIWMEDSTNYSIAVRAPRAPGAIDLNQTKGLNHFENVETIQRWVSRYKAASKAVQEKQLELRNRGNLFCALETCVMRDIELEHMVGDLRVGLNALAKHYGLSGKERKAA